MQRGHTILTLEEVIARLEANDKAFDTLDLSKIIINPTSDPEGVVSHVDDQSLARLAAAIKKNKKLRCIRIAGFDSYRRAEWTKEGAQAFGAALMDHPNLTEVTVDLQSYSLGKLNDGTQYKLEDHTLGFLHCLRGTASITSLRISTYCDSEYFYNGIGELLKNQKTLECISIDGCPLAEKECLTPSFTESIGKQNNLRVLSIGFCCTSAAGMLRLSGALFGLTTLQKLSLRAFDITDNSPVVTQSVANVLRANTKIADLNLDLELPELQHLVEALPSLENLREISITPPIITSAALEMLCVNLSRLPAVIVGIGSSKNRENPGQLTAEALMASVGRLVDGNKTILSFEMNFWGLEINAQHLNMLRPILSDPRRCMIRNINLGSTVLNLGRFFAQCARSNPNIMSVFTGMVHDPLERQLYFNRCTNRSTFILDALRAANAYYAGPTEQNILQVLPVEIILMVMHVLLNGATGIRGENIDLCNRLLLQNFERRRRMISDGSYQRGRTPITAWWQHSLFVQDRKVRIFKTKGAKALEEKDVRDEGGCTLM